MKFEAPVKESGNNNFFWAKEKTGEKKRVTRKGYSYRVERGTSEKLASYLGWNRVERRTRPWLVRHTRSENVRDGQKCNSKSWSPGDDLEGWIETILFTLSPRFDPPGKIRRFLQEEEEEEEVLSTTDLLLSFSLPPNHSDLRTLVFFSLNNTKERNPLFLLLVSSLEKSFWRNPRSSRQWRYLSRFRRKGGEEIDIIPPRNFPNGATFQTRYDRVK